MIRTFCFLVSLLCSSPLFGQNTLSLDNGWLGSVNAGATAAKELGSLLTPFASSAANLNPDPNLEIYRGVTYLMPLNEAKAKLGLTSGGMVSKTKVITGGFPRDSIFYYAFDGVFDGGYNKLHLLTDKADQVVAVQLVSESPRRDMAESFSRSEDWSFYNFVSNRRKATSRIWVRHTISFSRQTSDTSERWHRFSRSVYMMQPSGNESRIRIDTAVIDPDLDGYGYMGKKWKFLEISQLYLPRPLMETMLHCINHTSSR